MNSILAAGLENSFYLEKLVTIVYYMNLVYSFADTNGWWCEFSVNLT